MGQIFSRTSLRVLQFVVTAFLLATALPPLSTVEARFGGGRGVGRSSGGGGAPRSRFAPARVNPPAPPPPHSVPPQRQRSNPLMGFGSALAGGMLLSMALRHFGFGGTIPGLDFMLLAEVIILGFFWWKRRRNSAPQPWRRASSAATPAPIAGISSEEVEGIFMGFQEAWSSRSLAALSGQLRPLLAEELQQDLDRMKALGHLNRLENISCERITVMHSWNEDSSDFSYVRIAARIIDYMVDERSGALLEGDPHHPHPFAEF